MHVSRHDEIAGLIQTNKKIVFSINTHFVQNAPIFAPLCKYSLTISREKFCILI